MFRKGIIKEGWQEVVGEEDSGLLSSSTNYCMTFGARRWRVVGEMHSCGGELTVHKALGQQSKLMIVIA